MILAFLMTWRTLVIISIMIFVIYTLYLLLVRESAGLILKSSVLFMFVISLFFFLSAGRLLPEILYSLNSSLPTVEYFTIEMIRREKILHIFTTKFYDWPGAKFNMTYNDNSHFLFLFVTIFGFIYLLLKKLKTSSDTFPSVLFISFILLASKELNVDSIIKSSDYFSRLLRHG